LEIPRSRFEEWDGFNDPFWNLGQVILWAATRKREYVDVASDRAGLYDASYGLAATAVEIEKHGPTGGPVREEMVEDIRQKAMHGELKAYDYETNPPKEIPPSAWLKLEIYFDQQISVPVVRWRDHSSIVPAYNVRFSRMSVLQCFPEEAGDPSREEFWEVPENPPTQRSSGMAWNGLKIAFPNREIPKKFSDERLARIASSRMNTKINRDAVLRALGRKD
jgi:hypothetical protein